MSSSTYTVTVRVYNGLLGNAGPIPHAFVTIDGPNLRSPITVGYYPRTTSVSNAGTVRNDALSHGSVDPATGATTFEMHPADKSYTFEVTAQQAMNALQFAAGVASNPGSYQLIGAPDKSNLLFPDGYQCTGFARDVLSAASITGLPLAGNAADTIIAYPSSLLLEYGVRSGNAYLPFRGSPTSTDFDYAVNKLYTGIGRYDPSDRTPASAIPPGDPNPGLLPSQRANLAAGLSPSGYAIGSVQYEPLGTSGLSFQVSVLRDSDGKIVEVRVPGRQGTSGFEAVGAPVSNVFTATGVQLGVIDPVRYVAPQNATQPSGLGTAARNSEDYVVVSGVHTAYLRAGGTISDLWLLQRNAGNIFSLDEFTKAVLAANPGISSINTVQPGQQIFIPEKLNDGSVTYHYANSASINYRTTDGEYSMLVPSSGQPGSYAVFTRKVDADAGYFVEQSTYDASGALVFRSTGTQSNTDAPIHNVTSHEALTDGTFRSTTVLGDAVVDYKSRFDEQTSQFVATQITSIDGYAINELPAPLSAELATALAARFGPLMTLSTNGSVPGGQTITLTEQFDDGSSISIVNLAGGVSRVVTRDINGNVMSTSESVASGDGSITTTQTDASGAVTSRQSIQYFDDGSKVVTVTAADNTVRTTVYTDANTVFSTSVSRASGTQATTQYFDASGALIGTRQVQSFDDGSMEVTSRPDGYELRIVRDENGAVISGVEVPSYAQTFTSAISDTTSLINAIRSGQPLPQLASGLKLLNTLDRQQAIPYLGTASTIAQGALSLYNLANAFENGDALDQVSAAGNAIVAVDKALTALELGSPALSSVAGSISQALPGLSLIVAIKNDDPVGAAMAVGTMIQGSAFLLSNPIGWVLLAYSLYKAFEEPPEAWGIGTFKFAVQGTELALDSQGESFGKDRVASLMGAMKDYLDNVIESSQQSDPNHLLGIIPQRLGTLTWREARQDDPGYALRDPNPVTGQESLDFLRYNDDLTPYNADPTVEAQRRSLLERMVVSAIDREAIAPLWEVNTARLQQDIGDPNAGMTEEVRAARRGLLAAVDPLTNKPTAGVFRPVALDLNGDGRITTVSDAGNDRAFNWDGAGFDKQVGWVGGGEGLLWLDRNPNGIVDSGKELFSNSAVADAAKGIRSLSWVDANADGMIDAADPVFAQLKVWQDTDGDAVADFNELQSLESLGITRLDYSNGRFSRNGQDYALQSQDLEASSAGTRVSVVPEGIRVEFSNGQALVAQERPGLAGNDEYRLAA